MLNNNSDFEQCDDIINNNNNDNNDNNDNDDNDDNSNENILEGIEHQFENYYDFLMMLKDKIDNMPIPEQTHLNILKILKKHGEKFTENSTGTHIELINIKESTANEIFKYVDFVTKQNEFILQDEQQKELFKQQLGNKDINIF